MRFSISIRQTVLAFSTLFGFCYTTHALDATFPYGSTPQGNVCVTSDNYATPETMLGSWAMQQAVAADVSSHVLSAMFNSNNVVYAVGTAAIGDALGIANCAGGCNALNGICFALKFNNKSNYPYMIFQSVNIAANPNTFDIYLPGGGSGAFSGPCGDFWGTSSSVDWADHIESAPSCEAYFSSYATINSNYAVTYAGHTYTAKDTLIQACKFASSAVSGFNTQNFENVSAIPVICPDSLTQITGLRLSKNVTTIGTQTIHNLNTLSDNDFKTIAIKNISTTQMQDCKTPSSGYCGNVSNTDNNYQSSISASRSAPLLSSPNYCSDNPNFSGGFCSWNQGKGTGSDYCNASKKVCISCGNAANWCTCENGVLTGCVNS